MSLYFHGSHMYNLKPVQTIPKVVPLVGMITFYPVDETKKQICGQMAVTKDNGILLSVSQDETTTLFEMIRQERGDELYWELDCNYD